MKAFEAAYGAKFGKAVAKITDDVDELLAFYDFPAEHWIHLRTTNPNILNQKPPERSSSTGLDYCSCSFHNGFTSTVNPALTSVLSRTGLSSSIA